MESMYLLSMRGLGAVRFPAYKAHRAFQYEQRRHIRRTNTAQQKSRFETENASVTASDSTIAQIKLYHVRRWTHNETQALVQAIAQTRATQTNTSHTQSAPEIDWASVAQRMVGRSEASCFKQYAKLQQSIGRVASQKPTVHAKPTSKNKRYWTHEEDEQLLQLHAILGRKWKEISKSMQTRNRIQCMHRMNLIKARDAGQKLEDKKKKKAMKLKIKDMLKQKVTRVWTDDDTRMLRDLVAAQGKFNYGELRGQMPGFTYYQMYTALGRITRDENACGGWNIEERRALRRLAHEYPGDWRTVALHMPTRRSPEQCSMLYGRLLLGDATKVRRWTTEEDEQLKRMISTWRETLHTEPKPAESEKLEKLEKGPPKSQSFGRILQAFKRDVSSAIRAGSLAPSGDEAERLQQKKRDKRHAIPWTLIASYMDGRTAMQCKNRWYSKPVVQPTDACTEPWTREEDLALFRLDVKLPGKKKNVQRFLPRFRSLPVIAVRRRLVMRYVEMLRACRPGWDPEADGLEEVHMRCEVASWYAATAEGYRPSDPYTRPFDMDLNGYQEWVASGKS